MAEIESAEDDAINADGNNIEGIFPEIPFYLCIGSGNNELACFLIKAGADHPIGTNERTPLFQAIQIDNVELP
ncbi:hypothetical protein FPOAC1_009674 [Fusarium poae]|uniref:hypothetical protein n=1 Tax=Fusarium poae TaxID=36050 RepID=UPI001CEAB524|nr:hypothetical protein FPOAC1_009674 [Fusarium poae]KAG8670266.1 hypothetical protein FPOAC1_009674 [Fusarium poae]